MKIEDLFPGAAEQDAKNLDGRVEQLVAAGLSRDDAIIAAELSQKAALEAVKTVRETCDSAPTQELQVICLMEALQLIQANVQIAMGINSFLIAISGFIKKD